LQGWGTRSLLNIEVPITQLLKTRDPSQSRAFSMVRSTMRAITAAILGLGFLLATEANATEPRCVRPDQPLGTGNSMLTWRIPDDCPLTEGERQTKERCQSKPEGARPRGCWGYDLY
jgi:hypothetical protein